MILTRRVEIFISENDKELRAQHYKQVYEWRYLLVSGANELLSYLYSIDRLKYYKFINENSKIELGIIGASGKPVKENSASYVLLSERMKGRIPMDILNCLQRVAVKKYMSIKSDIFKGNSSLYSYKNNIPIPFSSISLKQISWDEEHKRYFFKLFGIRFGMILGRDRSGSKRIIDNCICGEYDLCESAIFIDDARKKLFLILNYTAPARSSNLDENRFVDAMLSVNIPIVTKYNGETKMIGNKEEYLHRRLQIQSATRRAQINSRYSEGGKGRKRKLQAVSRFHNKERDYIKTRIHTYTKMLIDYAVENRCKTINLINQIEKEKAAKKDPFLLRNWGYFGLRKNIEYKAKLHGITVNMVASVKLD